MPNVSDKSTSGVAQVIMPKFALSDAILSAQVDTCSLQENLSKVVGRFVVCKCLVGTNNICTVTGVLKSVGSSFFHFDRSLHERRNHLRFILSQICYILSGGCPELSNVL